MNNEYMYVYGLDLSLTNTGVVIFRNATPLYIDSIPTTNKLNRGKRLYLIYTKLKELIEKYPPHVVCIERGFYRFNKSTQAIYEVNGVVELLFRDHNIILYSPKEIKAAIVDGKASKEEVQDEILKYYNYIDFKNNDESDAFAVALTYLIVERGIKLGE